MGKKEKLKKKFLTQPKDFTYEELVSLLNFLGFAEEKIGRSTGSAVCFIHKKTGCVIRFHRPHPSNEIKSYLMKQIKLVLEKEGLL
jgi:predicted RNA binding protein YcfA (HicA-like mRNA interferase family)